MTVGFYDGLGIGALLGGVVLVLGNATYQHWFGEPHDRRVAVFQLKVDEIRRVSTYGQNLIRAYEAVVKDLEGYRTATGLLMPQVLEQNLIKSLASYSYALEAGDLFYLKLSGEVQRALKNLTSVAVTTRSELEQARKQKSAMPPDALKAELDQLAQALGKELETFTKEGN